MGNTIQNYESLSNPICGTEDFSKGFGTIYRHKKSTESLISSYFNGCDTLWDLFNYGVTNFGDGKCLGFREKVNAVDSNEFRWMSYQEVFDDVTYLSNSFRLHNIVNPVDSRDILYEYQYQIIGIFSRNRYEWIISQYAIYRCNGVVLPLSDSYQESELLYILRETNLRCILCDVQSCMKILECKRQNPDLNLSTLILFDNPKPELLNYIHQFKINYYNFHFLLLVGRSYYYLPVKPNPSDPCLIIYKIDNDVTPKGVIITHQNLSSSSQSLIYQHNEIRISPHSTMISYLPLNSIFEQLCITHFLNCGGSIGFSSEISKFSQDIKILCPTIYHAKSPYLIDLRKEILDGINKKGHIIFRLFDYCYNLKKNNSAEYNSISHSCIDKFFSVIKKKLGFTNLEILFTSGSTLPKETHEFFRIILGIPIIQSYGLTESSGLMTCENVDDNNSYDNSGYPIVCNEIRLFDTFGMPYSIQDRYDCMELKDNTVIHLGNPCCGRGEIGFRGFNRCLGYFKRPDLNTKYITNDGWFLTGDIGMWTLEGKLKIIDKKSNIFKMTNGNAVSIQTIESIYLESDFIDQIYIYGDTTKSELVAIVVPNESKCMNLLISRGIYHNGMGHILDNDYIKQEILRDMNENIAVKHNLKPFEIVHKIHIDALPLSSQSSPYDKSVNVNRKTLFRKYHDIINKMYDGYGSSLTKNYENSDNKRNIPEEIFQD